MNLNNLRKILNETTDIIVAERITIILVLVSISGIKILIDNNNKSSSEEYSTLKIINDSLPKNEHKYSNKKYSRETKVNESKTIFKFNPQTITKDQLLSIGFTEQSANNLIKYRKKGGKFSSKYDVKKIYGVSDQLYSRVEPYIVIKENKSRYTNKKESKPIDINYSSVEEWKSLVGIGDYYANKIVNFRDKLGGFYSVNQVKETYKLPDSTFEKIKPFLNISNYKIKKIKINDASEDELNNHPYIAPWQAQDIIKNRPIYGLEDLYELYTFRKKDKNQRIENYLEF